MKKYDLICCSHFLLHIKPEDISKVIDKMLKLGKQLVIIEPNPLVNLGEWEYYNFKHDYKSLLKDFKLVQINKIVGAFILES